MKKYIYVYLLTAFAFLANDSYGQLYIWEVGGGFGGANYLGDIGGVNSAGVDNSLRDIQLRQTSFALKAFARVRVAYRWNFAYNLTWARIRGADSLTTDWPERFARNLSFRTDIIELNAIGQYNFLAFPDLGGKKRYNQGLIMYAGMGISVFYFNPMGQLDGTWHNLQPLQTEGRENEYSRFSVGIPVNIGVTFEWRNQHNRFGHPVDRYRRHRISWDFTMRVTATDYLDDISTDYPNVRNLDSELAQSFSSRTMEVIDDPRRGDIHPNNHLNAGSPRGDPSDNDFFLTSTVTYSYILKTAKRRFRRPKYSYMYGNIRKRGKRARY